MTPQQRARIPEIFDEALDREGAAREGFLREACAGDQEVYREVKSLLGESFHTEDFLKHSALSLATRALSHELTPLHPGARLGRYEILRELGRGGMGDVFQARDDIGLSVAIKVLPDYFAQDAERVSRFESEARKMAKLQHPNIAGIHGREVIRGWRFLVLEYVEGETLEMRLEKGALPVREALPIFAQIADALAATHGKDIVHRDLKPSNIMLTPARKVKLLDFGIAKHFHHLEVNVTSEIRSDRATLSQSLTLPGFTPGTLPYMSPEQRLGTATDHTTDLWAFGVVFYEALTGLNPFRRDTREDTTSAIATFTPDWKLLPRDTPRSIRELLQRCLAKTAATRLQDAREVKAIIDAELKSGFVLPAWWQRLRQYFTRRVTIALACVAALVLAYSAWRYYQNQFLRLAVAASANATCTPIDATSLTMQLNRLPRIRASQQVSNSKLRLQLGCADKATLLQLVNEQGITLFAHQADTEAQALARLEPVLAALAKHPGGQVTALNAQLNIVAPSLTNLKPEEQNILNLDQWDNEAMLNAAIELVKKLIAEQGNSATLQAALSRAHLSKFRLKQDTTERQQAYDAYTLALTMEPDSADALLAAGDYNTALGVEGAAKYYQEALRHRPTDPQAVRGLARSYEKAGKFDLAEENFILAVLLRPQYWSSHNELGAFYLERENYLLSSTYLLNATKLIDNPTVYVNLGAAYYLQGREAEAFLAYTEALKRSPHSAAYFGCGVIRYNESRFVEAADFLHKAKELAVNDAELWGYWGQALYFLPGSQNEAQQALLEAIKIADKQTQEHTDGVEKLPYQKALWQALTGQAMLATSTINQTLSTSSEKHSHELLEYTIAVFHVVKQDQTALQYVQEYLQSGGQIRNLEREPLLTTLRDLPDYRKLTGTNKN